MNIVVISEEKRILHIVNRGYEVEYIVYNSRAEKIDEGFLESVSGMFDSYKIVEQIIVLIQENILFSSPYIYMYGDETDFILKLINLEKKKKDKTITNFIESLANTSDYFTSYRERMEYV